MFMAFDFSVSAVVETALIDQLEVGTRAYQQKHVHRRKSYINSRESSPHSPKEISKRKNNWKLSFLVESKYVDRHWYFLWAIWNSNRILTLLSLIHTSGYQLVARQVGYHQIQSWSLDLSFNDVESPLHYAKVVKTGFKVVNFDKLILHQFSTKISQIFNDGV